MNQFEIPQNLNPMENIIKVIGVGGGGSNAAKHLYNLNVKNVDFIVCNTDLQHLQMSPIPNKIQLGRNLTKGLGAGCKPETGREAAIESKEEIKRALENNTEMLFITAGLGGGTGTGAAPIIAEVARSLNILTVAIVTLPFKFEGKKKTEYAEKGLEELKKHIDSIIVIPNEKLKEIFPGMKMTEAFAKADDVVATAAKSIAEIITNNLHINVDFNDVRTVLQDSGTAIMGTGIARGENRAIEALKNAINNPLLVNNSISGAKHILLSITTGSEDITTDEFDAITNYIQEVTGGSADLIPGYGTDASIGDAVSITIVATGFQEDINPTETDINFYTTKRIEEVNLSTKKDKEEKQYEEVNKTPQNTSVTNNSSETTIKIDVINTQTAIELSNNTNNNIVEEKTELNTIEHTDPTTTNQENNETNYTYNTLENIDNNSETISSSDEISLNIPSDYTENPTAKIIDKSSNVASELKENIDKLTEINNKRKAILNDISNPDILKQLEDIPAYLRNKNIASSEKNNSKLSNPHDHSNYTIDENGNIKPGSPYLNDQVD